MTGHALLVVGVLCMSAGAVLLPTNVMKLVTSVVGFLLAAAGARESLHAFAWSPLALAVCALLAAFALSAALSGQRKPIVVFPSVMRSDGLLTQVLYAVLALLASQLGPDDRETVLRALVWGAAWVAVVAHWQSYGMAQWALPAGATPAMMDTRVRACGTLANPLFLGGYCALVLPIATSRAALWGHADDAVVAALLANTLVLSGSRAAWLGALVALPVALWQRPYLGPVAAGLAAVLAASVYARWGYLGRASWKDIMHDSVRSTVSGRRYIWAEVWKQIRQRPLFGHGVNAIAIRNPDPAANDFFDTPHNGLLHIMHGIGIVGALCYVAVWVAAVWHAGPLLAGLVGYGVWMMLAWEHLGPSNAFWGVAGMTATP